MRSKGLTVAVLLVVIVVLAAVFRLYDLQNFPGGLFPDEAANGEDALLVLDGDYRPFYPRGNGREGLYYYLQAASIAYFGIGVWQLKLVSALIGVATVAAVYFAARPWFGRTAGLLAALFLATNHWHVTMSRTGFRAILIPLFVALFTAWIGYTIRSVKDGRKVPAYVYAILAGAAFAGGFYTYIAYRVMVGVVLAVAALVLLDDLIVEWYRHRAVHIRDLLHVERYWKHLVVGCIAALLVFAPLLLFFIEQPEAFFGRAGQVSVFNKELQDEFGGGTLLGTILYSTRETLLAFFAGDGDLNWRHNVPGNPLLNPVVAVLCLLGIAWAIRGTFMVVYKLVRRQELHLGVIYPYLLLLSAAMLMPVITTAEGMPHGLRSIGLVVPAFIFAGTAGAVILNWVRRQTWPSTRSAILGMITGVLLLGVAYDGTLYFIFARNDAEAAYAYRSDLTEVSKYILHKQRQEPEAPRPLLVLDPFSLQTVHFLTNIAAHDYVTGDTPHPDEDQHLWRQLDPATSHETPLAAGQLIIFTQSTFPDADRYAEFHADVIELVDQRFNRFGEEIMRVYQGVTTEEGLESEASLDA